MKKPAKYCKLTNEKYTGAVYEYQPDSHHTFFEQFFAVFTKKPQLFLAGLLHVKGRILFSYDPALSRDCKAMN
jgi:hypothetical protein